MKFPNYVLGLFTGFCLAGLYFMAPAIVSTFDTPPKEPKDPEPSIEVIDTYNGCDILRYAPPRGAKFQYFMDCTRQ